MRYGGTVDLLAVVENAVSLIDFKSTSIISDHLIFLRLNGIITTEFVNIFADFYKYFLILALLYVDVIVMFLDAKKKCSPRLRMRKKH